MKTCENQNDPLVLPVGLAEELPDVPPSVIQLFIDMYVYIISRINRGEYM